MTNTYPRKLLALLSFVSMLVIVSIGYAQPESEIQRRFNNWDKNKDGVLTKVELPLLLRRNFDKADADGNGEITFKEHEAFIKKNARRPGGKNPRIPEGVRVYRDLKYVDKDPHERHVLDIYLPKQDKNVEKEAKVEIKYPVIVWIHGGAWRAGSKNYSPAIAFSAKGYAVVSINYRLSQHAIFPAQIHDCKAAIRWLRAHANEYSLDSDRIGIWGSSAGGHLVALMGTSGGVKDLEGDLGNLDQSSKVQAVCDWFGPTEIHTMTAMTTIKGPIDHDAPDSPESRLLGGTLQENVEKAKVASPVTYVSKDDPPFLIMHGGKDPLVPLGQSELLHKLLKAKKVQVELKTYPDAGHGFAKEPTAIPSVQSFFEKHLKNGK